MSRHRSSEEYDAIIIGAGIGGLVCGCYLAKAGMKVLICEQHHKPGGYCTSFKRKGFTFDAAADCFGAYREGGITRKVFEELGIDKKLEIIQFDPSLIIHTKEFKIRIWRDTKKTIEELQSLFPEEKTSISNFFNFLSLSNPATFAKIKNWTFQKFIDSFFSNKKLKTILSYPLLVMAGLPPTSMSAFLSGKLYYDFILDGGYYPVGGMQSLPDALANRFQEFGGEMRFCTLVKKILIQDGAVVGVKVENGDYITTRYVVSNCDARQTFLNLLGEENLDDTFSYSIKNMTPSISNFIAYLGIDDTFSHSYPPGTAVLFLEHYNLDKAYKAMLQCDLKNYCGYSFRTSKNNKTINILVPVSFKNKNYWKKNKQKFLDSLIEKAEKYSLPNLSQHLVYKDAGTPYTLYRYTLNYKGASYGWASTVSQLAVPGFKKPSFIKGLYLTGHWSTLGLGIPGVAYVGYDTAKIILRKYL